MFPVNHAQLALNEAEKARGCAITDYEKYMADALKHLAQALIQKR